MNGNSSQAEIKMVLASPRGFCAGVDRAITIVEKALEIYGAPIYVQHEIVHNKHVVQRLRDDGAVFVENVEIWVGVMVKMARVERVRGFGRQNRVQKRVFRRTSS